MDEISRRIIQKIVTFLLIIAITFSLLGATYDLIFTFKNGGIDLRNRVVGARLISRGLDPYYYRWKPGDPEIFIDPEDYLELPVSRVTVPPTGLLLYTPFAHLPYLYQRFIWFFLQWAAFLVSLLILAQHPLKLKAQFLIGFGLFFIGTSISWRMHVDAGQTYIFYVLLIAAAYGVASSKKTGRNELAGLLIGIATSMRFSLILFILPLLIFKKIRLLIATLGGVVLSILSSILLFGIQPWLSYFSAVHLMSQLSSGVIQIAPNPENPVLPMVVEGVSFDHAQMPILPGANSSFPLLIQRFLGVHIPTSYLIAGLMLGLLAYSVGIVYLKHRAVHKAQIPSLDAVFIVGSLMVLSAEFLIPVPRYSYTDIQFLIPLILVLKQVNFQHTIPLYLTGILSLGLLILCGLFPWLHTEIVVGEGIVLFTLMLMSLLQFVDPPSATCSEKPGNVPEN